MTSFGNITFENLGLTVLFARGYLDMPPRKGDSYYDWGDEFEPLISEKDMFFGTRTIVIDCLYRGNDLYAVQDAFKNQIPRTILIFDTAENRNIAGVSFFKMVIKKNYKDAISVEFHFIESNPIFQVYIPDFSGNSGVRINGKDFFASFGLLVEDVKGFQIPELKISEETTDKKTLYSRYRKIPEISVKVNGLYASKGDMDVRIKGLNSMFAKPGLHLFEHRGTGYQVFIDEGYNVEINRLHVVINFKMKVMAMYNVDEIVRLVIDQVEIATRPQSDLAVVDVTSPAFVKGKDTFKAADSSKLNGQSAEYYAKQSDINNIEITDFAKIIQDKTQDI